jgi:hypothetical protein
MPRSIDDLLAHADALADRFEEYEPREEDRGEPALMALQRTAYRRALIERETIEVVRQAREAGDSWARIGRDGCANFHVLELRRPGGQRVLVRHDFRQ